MSVIQARTAMMASAISGTVVLAGNEIFLAPTPHSDD
jgi:hypothetical protein